MPGNNAQHTSYFVTDPARIEQVKQCILRYTYLPDGVRPSDGLRPFSLQVNFYPRNGDFTSFVLYGGQIIAGGRLVTLSGGDAQTLLDELTALAQRFRPSAQ